MATETANETDLPDELPPGEMRADAMPKSGKDDVRVVTRASMKVIPRA